MVEALQQHGADVNHQLHDGSTALMFSVRMGHGLVIDTLLVHGADVNLRVSDGSGRDGTPLMPPSTATPPSCSACFGLAQMQRLALQTAGPRCRSPRRRRPRC